MILGLTGGIASGKSTVAKLFIDLGAQLVEADDIARQVVEPGTIGLKRIEEAFGPEVIAENGTLKRGELGAMVFGDPAKLNLLNSLLHPLMEVEMEMQLQKLRKQGPVILSAAILFEAGWERLVEKVLVVTVDPKVQLKRLMARDGFTCEEAQKRIAAQLSLAEKAARADFLIDTTDGSNLEEQVEKIWREIR